MLDGLDLVHMNGRVYDPRIARFVSANPIVQSPDNGQSWNRYSYVWNNPTNATDPTGYQAKNENDKKRTDPPPENEPKCKGQECIDQRNTYYHVSYPNGPSNGAGKGKADAPGATEGKETSTSAPNPRRQISAEEYAVADRAMAQYMQCESIECIRAAQSNMLSIRNSLVAAHVSTYDLSGLDAHIAQAGMLTGQTGHALETTAILGIGQLGQGAGRGAGELASAANYRTLFKQARPDLPSGWQVHYSMPQKYEELMRASGVNIHDVQFLRGVSPQVHSKITTEWSRFDKAAGGNPSAAQIADFAKQLDKRYGGSFMWPGF